MSGTARAERPAKIVSPAQFAAGWTVFAGFDADGMVVVRTIPMQMICIRPDRNIIVRDLDPDAGVGR